MPTTVAIAASSSGANQIVAGAAGFKYRVLAFLLSFSGTVNAKWQSAANDLTGLVYGLAGVNAPGHPLVPAPTEATPKGLFTTNAGEDLNLNLSGAVAVGGYVVYEKILASQ